MAHGVLVGCLGSLFVIGSNSWRFVVEVYREDSLGTIHEERRVADGPARSCPQAPEHYKELNDLVCAELVQLVEDPRLKAL